jgi:hypothetical protein
MWDSDFAVFAELWLLVCRPHRLSLMRQIGRQRRYFRHKALVHGTPRYGSRAIAFTLAGRYYALNCMRVLYMGCKILNALRRNVREGRTRSRIMAAIMQHTLGKGRPSTLLSLLPYTNYYTCSNEAVLGPKYSTVRVRSNELVVTETEAVQPARNVKRRVCSSSQSDPQTRT